MKHHFFLCLAVVHLALLVGSTRGNAVPVSDDFSSGKLNRDLWQIVDPAGDSAFAIVDKKLIISLPEGTEHDVWASGNRTARVMQPVKGAEWTLEAKFDSVVREKHQIQGILVEEDAKNFLRFDVSSDGKSVRLFAAEFSDGKPNIVFDEKVIPENTYRLRVTRDGSDWTLSFAGDDLEWLPVVTFQRQLDATMAGVFAGNAQEDASPAFTAVVDYVFNTAAPTVPEDGAGYSSDPVYSTWSSAGFDRREERPEANGPRTPPNDSSTID